MRVVEAIVSLCSSSKLLRQDLRSGKSLPYELVVRAVFILERCNVVIDLLDTR